MRAGDPIDVSSAVARDGGFGAFGDRLAGSDVDHPGSQNLQPAGGGIDCLDRASHDRATAPFDDRLHRLEGLRRGGMACAPARPAPAHLAVDADHHEVVAAEQTAAFVGDAEVLPALLEQLSADESVASPHHHR